MNTECVEYLFLFDILFPQIVVKHERVESSWSIITVQLVRTFTRIKKALFVIHFIPPVITKLD